MMNYKVFILLPFLILGCATQKSQIKRVVSAPKLCVVVADTNRSYDEFDGLVKELKYDCNLDNSVEVYGADKYIRLDFSSKLHFKPHSFELTKQAEKSLKCIANTILNYNNFTFQLIGHSNDSISMAHNRYLSNNRAIIAAELLYKEGVYDVYAKGCAVKKDVENYIDSNDIFIDSGLEIYVYHNNIDLKNPCP